MKISALIATDKAGECISNALESVRIQTLAACEVIVAEYGPPDRTEEVVRAFAATARRPVHYEKLTAHTAAEARNRLVELATGDVVAFLEPCDTWTPRHLANAAQQLSTRADLAVAKIRFFDPRSGRSLNEVAAPAQLFTNPVRALFTQEAIPSPSCVAFRRALAARAGAFDSQLRTCASRDFWLRCALIGARFVATNRTTCQCAMWSDPDPDGALLAAEHAVLFFEKHRELAAVPAALRRRQLAASLVAHGRLLRKFDHARAAQCFWRAWSLQPVQVQALGEFALTESHTAPAAASSNESPPSASPGKQAVSSDPE